MRNRSVLYFTGFIVAILGFLMFDYTARKDYLRKTNLSRRLPAASENIAASANDMSASESIAMRARFLIRFKDFATRMNFLSDDPDRSDELLNNFSQTVKPEDIVALNGVLNDSKARQGERRLALELMVLNQDFNVHDLLNTFVQNENFTEQPEFEISLRAQAIEGLTLFADKKLVRKNLENLQVRTRHAFLHDRAEKALQYLSNSQLDRTIGAGHAEASSP